MSKSKGEFLTVSLLEERGYDPLVYRFFCMQSHYRKNLVFSWENLDNAKIAYNKLVAKIAALKDNGGAVDASAMEEGRAKFRAALDNDLNTSLAVTALYDVFKMKTNDETKLALVKDFEKVLDLGLIDAAEKISVKTEEEKAPEISAELLAYVNEKIEARKEAKASKNYALADAIRAELLEKGITLIDTKEGTKFTLSE